MIVKSATYLIRLNLGNYQHEELSVTLEQEIDEQSTPEKLLERARLAVQSQTASKRKKEKGQDEQV